MSFITDTKALAELYDGISPRSLTKVADHVTPKYKNWIEQSRFMIMSTVGPEGADGSPRGDRGPVVRINDPKTILIPDWRGNNRLDTLRNIVRDGRLALMFMVPGSTNVVRVNGHAKVSVDPALTGSFEQNGIHPRTVVVMTVDELYFQCAKAILRSQIWSGEDHSADLPTAGEFLKEAEAGFDAETYDATYHDGLEKIMW